MEGNGVSQITFTLSGRGIGNNPERISVSSTAPNRYGDKNAQAGLNVSFVSADAVNITLTPTRVYKPGENVNFTLTVQGSNTIRIVPGVRIGLRTVGGPPMWVVVSVRKARYLRPVRTQSPRVLRALSRRPKLQRWQ